MAGTNDFLAFATSGGANVVSQGTYAAASYIPIGLGSGILPSNVYNKMIRQGSIGSYMLGQIICDVLGVNAADNGDTTTLLANLKSALLSLSFPTGRARFMLDTSAATGFVPMNDGTISNAGGGGTIRANADTVNLYTMVWNNVSNTYAPVTGGRGANAAADFAALKPMQLLSVLGRALVGAGAGSGLTSRALGSSFGGETNTLVAANLPPHVHGYQLSGNDNTVVGGGGANAVNSGLTATSTDGGPGTSSAFQIMQPSTAFNVEVKL